MMKIKFKPLIFFIFITLLIGIGGSLFGDSSSFNTINKPFFAPPGFIFPIVWTILFILMGISAYMVYISDTSSKKNFIIYFVQLIVNSLWTLFFFRFKLYLFSFWWIILLIALVIIMIYIFYKIKPAAGYLQIPYLIWLIFAAILNYSIYLLN